LAFRVFVIPIERHIAVPSLAQQLGREHFFPASAEQVQTCCTAAAKTALVSPHLSTFREFWDQILEASRLASLYWLRHTSWRSEKPLHSAKLLLDSARESASQLPCGEIRDFADRTADVVEGEIQRGGRPLAAAFHNIPAEPPDDEIVTEFNMMSWSVSLSDAVI
jgi:hypothetical protein